MKFDTVEDAVSAILSGRFRVKTTQYLEVVAANVGSGYRLAVYDVVRISPFQAEFNRYVEAEND